MKINQNNTSTNNTNSNKNINYLNDKQYEQPTNIKHNNDECNIHSDDEINISELQFFPLKIITEAPLFDLIHSPLKLTQPLHELIKVDESYQTKLNNQTDSKKIYYTKHKKKHTIIHLTISTNGITIHGLSNNKFEFSKPTDFYLPKNEAASIFYKQFHEKVNNCNIEEYLNYVDGMISSGFDTFPIAYPIILERNNKTNGIPSLKNKKKYKFAAIKINFGDKIPKKCCANYKKNLKKNISKIIYQRITKKLKILFENTKIFRFVALYKHFSDEKEYKVKMCLSVVAYYVKDGPWKMNWIAYGYDPASDINNFKYQMIPFRVKLNDLVIDNHPKIIKTIEENRALYLKTKCDKAYGFLSEKLVNLIQNSLFLDPYK